MIPAKFRRKRWYDKVKKHPKVVFINVINDEGVTMITLKCFDPDDLKKFYRALLEQKICTSIEGGFDEEPERSEYLSDRITIDLIGFDEKKIRRKDFKIYVNEILSTMNYRAITWLPYDEIINLKCSTYLNTIKKIENEKDFKCND